MVDLLRVPDARATSAEQHSATLGHALDKLTDTFVRGVRSSALSDDARVAQEAQEDIVTNTINPEREANEAAYASVTLKNQLVGQMKTEIGALSDPQSEVVRMNPDEYKKRLSQSASEALTAIEGNLNADVLSKVFTEFQAKNQLELIGRHAQSHLLFQTNASATALKDALDGLGGVDDFDRPFEEVVGSVIDEGWNKSLLKRDEVASIITGVALEHARQGDRGVLDYAINSWNLATDSKHQAKIETARREYENFRFEEGEADARKSFIDYQTLSDRGQFTLDQRDTLLDDEDALKRWGASRILGWYKNSRVNAAGEQENLYNEMAFEKGLAMSFATNKQFQEVSDSWLQAALAQPDAPVGQIALNFADRLRRQGRKNTAIGRELNAWFGNMSMEEGLTELPAFNRAKVFAEAFEQVMPVELFVEQMGDRGYRNWKLLTFYASTNGGDFAAAHKTVASIQKTRKEQGLSTKMSANETEARDEAFDEIVNGDHEMSDPKMRKFFGFLRRGSESVFTGDIRNRMNRAYEANVLLGMQPELAMETAGDLVASQSRVFGNELQFTGGASISEFVGLPKGSDPQSIDAAFRNFVEYLGDDMNPDDVHINVLPTGEAQIHILENGVVKDRKYLPASVIGTLYTNDQALREEHISFENDYARKASETKANNRFISRLAQDTSHLYEDTPRGSNVVVPAFDGKPEITFGELMEMTPEQVTATRKHATNYSRRNIRKVVELLGNIGGKLSQIDVSVKDRPLTGRAAQINSAVLTK